MHDTIMRLGLIATSSALAFLLAERVVLPLLLPPSARQAPLEAPAPRGQMPEESNTLAGYYRRFRFAGLSPLEAAREALIYKWAGR